MRPLPATLPSTTPDLRRCVDTNCTALSLITSLISNTVRNFPTHGQLSQPKEAQPLSQLDIRLMEHFDLSALWSDGPEVALNWPFPYPIPDLRPRCGFVLGTPLTGSAHGTRRSYKLVTSGTDNHLVLWDLRPTGISGNKMEKVCEMAHITLNKNAVFGDASALSPGGVRIGSPAMTSRGLLEADFEQVAEFLHRAMQVRDPI
jgi:hypothetical protein